MQRIATLPDGYVYVHKETSTYLVQLATGRSAVLWQHYPQFQVNGSNCLALATEEDLQHVFDIADTLGVFLRLMTG